MRWLVSALSVLAATAPEASYPDGGVARTTSPELPRAMSNMRQMRLASPQREKSMPGRNYLARHGASSKDMRPLKAPPEDEAGRRKWLARERKRMRQGLKLLMSQAHPIVVEPGTTISWKDISLGQALAFVKRLPWTAPDGTVIRGPRNIVGEECPFPWEPLLQLGQPLGMYHCSYCGDMVVAGCTHPDDGDVAYPTAEEAFEDNE